MVLTRLNPDCAVFAQQTVFILKSLWTITKQIFCLYLMSTDLGHASLIRGGWTPIEQVWLVSWLNWVSVSCGCLYTGQNRNKIQPWIFIRTIVYPNTPNTTNYAVYLISIAFLPGALTWIAFWSILLWPTLEFKQLYSCISLTLD